MLDGLVTNLLNRVLGMYVQNFDPKQLSFGIWSGALTLRNLELRKEALDQLHLPLNVVEGHIGELTLVIPWANLRGAPVKVNIENVWVLASPREDADYDPEDDERRQQKLKIEKLESAELLKERNSEGLSKEEEKKQQSFTASLTTAIIDNLQVNVKNIHIRYEDSISAPGHPFAAGLTLRDFSAVSTDGHWKPAFVQSTEGSSHKLAKLGALAVYWDTDTKLMGTGKGTGDAPDTAELLKKFEELSTEDDSATSANHQYILKPVSGQAGIEMDKTGKIDRPKMSAKLFFDELGFVLDEDQYRDSLSLVDLFHYFIRHQENRRLQPKSTPKENPRAWLLFATNAVHGRIHERNRRWTWDYFRERRDDRLLYIQLFKKKKKEEKLTPEESSSFESLEKKLVYEDLRFWRSVARNQLRKENVGVRKVPQKSTWTSWVWGSGQKEASDESQMSEEQRNELYTAIDFDEKKAIAEAVDLPKDTIKLALRISLQTGSFTLKRDPHGKTAEVLKLLFDNFHTSFIQRPDSFLANVSLQGMRLYDGTTDGSLFPQILSVKDAPAAPDAHRIEHSSDDAAVLQELERSDEDKDEQHKEAFFNLVFEKNPLDGSADSALSMRLKAIEFIHNPRFIVEIAKFFKPPERHMESIGALMDSAGEAVEGIRKQTRAGLEFALEEHKSLNAHLDLQAPLIIVPDSVTQSSSICLILDAGHISVNSELVDKDTIRDVQSKQKQQYTEEDYQRLEGLMYDKFMLKLDSTQVLIGPSIEATRRQLQDSDDEKHLHVIDRISMNFLVELCIVPKDTELTKFRITGNLPVLHASISDAKYKSLMKLLDVAIPKFDEPKTDEKQVEKVGNQSQQKSKSATGQNSDKQLRSRSKSFQFSAQEHELILAEDGEEDNQQEFKDASAGEESTEVASHRKLFEFKFTVDRLQGSLYRSDGEGQRPDQLLAELIAQGFSLDFYQRPFDMIAEVSLKTLALEDHVEETPLPEFKNIISSENQSKDAEEDLFKLKFVKVNAASPDLMSTYEGFAINLDVYVSTINLIVTRKTLLTLLDFVLVTFTNQDESPVPPPPGTPPLLLADNSEDVSKQVVSNDKIRIKADLQGIAVVLNNDGIRLATLTLHTASVALILHGKSMRIGAKLGNMSFIDDINQGAAEDSPFRQLLTIEGQELADFTYETFDADKEAYPGHDSAVHLRSGSIKINFVTEPFRKILDFAVKFGRMQAIFNAARQVAANRAENIQQGASKMHFDILVRTPIVVFPKVVMGDTLQQDLVTAYLGEIYASNKFVPLTDSETSDTANDLSAGIRNIRLTSLVHYGQDRKEELELIDKVDLGFNMTYVEHKPSYKRPDMEIQASLSDIKLKITPQQLKLLLGLSRSIPQAFAGEAEEKVEQAVQKEIPKRTTEPAKALVQPQKDTAKTEEKPAQLGPELGSDAEKWTKLDMLFKAGTVGLELIQGSDDEPVGDLQKASLSRFSLNETNVKLRMMSDGSLETELLIQSFTIQDTRKAEANKFRKIMSLINSDITQQFMANVTMSGGDDKSLLAIVTIDSPRVIFSLEYLFAILAFINAGLISDEPEGKIIDIESVDEIDVLSDTPSSSNVGQTPVSAAAEANPEAAGTSMSFRANLVDAQVILLASPTSSSSDAIVLGMKQAIVARQHAMTLQVEKVGMFLCKMDSFESRRLRILDDFSIATSVDVRSQSKDSSITNIQVDIEPLVLRLSLRDLMIVNQIVAKVTSNSSEPKQDQIDSEPQRIKDIKNASRRKSVANRRSSVAATKTVMSSTTRQSSGQLAKQPQSAGSTILKREEMNIHMSGIRLVLIGDVHGLPMIDWSIKEFAIDVRDWSGALTAEMTVKTFFNVYNFSKSAWEPLVEPWSLGFHMARDAATSKLAIDLFSHENLEVTMTSATIALGSKMSQYLSANEDVLSKPRETNAPYRIRNYTGFPINVWTNDEESGREGAADKLPDGEERPWRFQDPTTTRETLAPEGATGLLGVKLEGSGFDSVDRIPVSREGETIYSLEPRKDKVLHRLMVEVKLGPDAVKYITFRSPLLVENNTQIPIDLGLFDTQNGNLVKQTPIPPGESRPAPVGAAFSYSLVFRPSEGFGYSWSNDKIFWKDVVKQPTRTITCQGEQPDSSPPFYFQSHAVINTSDPLSTVYPYMKIRLSAPVEIQNLLPYDFKYRIYDKHTKRDWTNFLRKGGISPGHVVNLSHLLLISVDLQDTPFRQSEFAIINSPDRDFSREKSLQLKDGNDLTLRLKLHYYNVPDSGGAFKVTVYSPYVLLNRTGLELDVRSKAFMGSARAAAGAGVFANTQTGEGGLAKPFMFSFSDDNQKNRALIKVGDSNWSKPQSFNAIGSQYSLSVPASQGRSEMHIGVSIKQGEGKYNLTNVVTLAPRFVINNRIGEEINIREPGSSEIHTLKNGERHPTRFMRQSSAQQLSLCFPGLDNQWSSAFHIANVGRVHVKLAKSKQAQQLIRVEILMEEGTIFIHLSYTKHWPFSIQNESDTEIVFFQANPNLTEDDEDRGAAGWRPIRYRLPTRSIMPYAWDFPASKNKDLVLDVNGRQRNVKLAEIGQQLPFKIPQESGGQKAIDINVVADGPKQTLALSNWKQSLSLYKQKSGQSSKSTNTGFEVKELDVDVTFKANIRLAGVGLSLINQNLRELVYVTFREIELKYNESALYQTVNWTTKWIQIDNQLYGGIFPILLYPSVVPKTGKELEAHPIFHTAITRVKDDSYGVLYIKYFSLLLQQLTVEIDEDFIFALLEFSNVPGASWNPEVSGDEGKLCDEQVDLPEPQREEQGQDVYFELLHLQPMQLDLSFVRTERINAEDTMAINNPFMFAVNVLTMSLGNVNDAPLRYNALILENARITPNALITNIQGHYVQESLRQVHVVLGSADFLGNPVGLFNNVSSGVADIFYEPYQGLVMTDRPQDLGIGIAKGASSFVKKSVFGLSDSMAKFTGSISKGLAAASMDKEFQDARRMSKSRNRPKHALYGVTAGGNAFAASMASGIGGLARHPLEGAEKDGVAGFMKGVGKGFLGLATKPAIGAFDLASNLAEGVRNTTTVFDGEGLDRVRFTRFIGQDGIVRPYSQREAVGQFWLKTLDDGKYFGESYLAHLELPGKELIVMLTYNGIMLVRTKALKTEWDVPLKDVQRISKERTGMNISLKEGRSGPFVPVQDEGSRNWLYRQIAVAVNAYNAKWQPKV